MDFLSAVTLGVTGNADCLVLNSVANVEKAAGLWTATGASDASLTVTKPDGGRLTLLPNGMGRVSPTVPPSMTVART